MDGLDLGVWNAVWAVGSPAEKHVRPCGCGGVRTATTRDGVSGGVEVRGTEVSCRWAAAHCVSDGIALLVRGRHQRRGLSVCRSVCPTAGDAAVAHVGVWNQKKGADVTDAKNRKKEVNRTTVKLKRSFCAMATTLETTAPSEIDVTSIDVMTKLLSTMKPTDPAALLAIKRRRVNVLLSKFLEVANPIITARMVPFLSRNGGYRFGGRCAGPSVSQHLRYSQRLWSVLSIA